MKPIRKTKQVNIDINIFLFLKKIDWEMNLRFLYFISIIFNIFNQNNNIKTNIFLIHIIIKFIN